MSKEEKVYYEEAGKGTHRRVEDREKIASNWDKIDWSKKTEDKQEEVCATCLGKGGIWDCGWYYECTTCGK
jgi:hypothetical protein